MTDFERWVEKIIVIAVTLPTHCPLVKYRDHLVIPLRPGGISPPAFRSTRGGVARPLPATPRVDNGHHAAAHSMENPTSPIACDSIPV